MKCYPARFWLLLPAALLTWGGLHWGADAWLFQTDAVSWQMIRRHLFLEGALLFVVAGALAVVMRRAVTHRVRWLTDETARIERGEAPREALPGGDSIASLSAAIRRMTLRLGNLRRAIDEHAIIAFTDRQGVITFANDKFCAISGYSRKELLGNTHRIINSGRHPKEFFRDLWKTISSGRVWSGEIENRARDGSQYFVATTIVPCPGADGKPEQYIAIRTDITEQKAASERLRLMSEELAAQNSDLETLIHAVSHDLRTPLVNVQGFASVIGEQTETVTNLLRDAVDGRPPERESAYGVTRDMAEAVRFICAGTEKMDALLKGMLIFSRLGRAAPMLQRVDADALVRESLAATRYQIEASGAKVAVGPLPSCLADPGLLGQAFSNLIDNAVKYREPDRPLRLDISGAEEEGRCVYRFGDNGIGIAPEHQEKIFELFHRLDPRHSNGHGLGLAIVRRAMDRMGGTVTVESPPDGGTIFAISLPAAGSAFRIQSENVS